MNKLLIATLTLFAAAYAHADFIGVHAGMGVWNVEMDGDVGVTEQISSEDLGISDDSNTWYYLAVEHPVPVLPNVRITNSPLELEGDATLTRDFTFEEETFSASDQVSSDIDLSHIDYTLYYEILDTITSIDLGLTGRAFDGEASIGSTSIFERVAVDGVIPMLYSRVQVDLPLTGFYAGGTLNYVSLSDNTLQDLELRVGYMTSALVANIGVELGYRILNLELEDSDDFQSDITIDGIYAAVVFHF